jgi:hypothetical protein
MDSVLVTGTIDAGGRFTAGWWITPNAEMPRAGQTHSDTYGDWQVVALDGEDRVLAQASATLAVQPACPHASRQELTAVLPIPDGTSTVAVLRHGAQVYRREAAPEPPALRLDERLEPTLRRQALEVPIHVEGPPPGPGAYLVATWETADHPPVSLGVIDVGAGHPAAIPLDLARLPGGDDCRLAVTYFDGIRSVTSSSGSLYLEPRPGVPVITSPQPGNEVYSNTWLNLVGSIDGEGDHDALEWLVDSDIVGTGPRAGVTILGAGAHTVSLRHMAARTSVGIVVHPPPSQEIETPAWEPPWRSRLRQP